MSDSQERRAQLYALLGDLPECHRKISVEKLGEEGREYFLLEKLRLDLNGEEAVPAYFVRPKNASGPFPTVLYHHAHSGDYALGKDELLAGRSSLQTPPYAEELTRRGYAALCCDTWAFGERSTRSESKIFKHLLWTGRVMWGMMVYDSLRALDYLTSRSDVDAARIATMGLSMGSTMAWWTAALDERVKVCIDLCCLTDFQALLDHDGLDLHGLYYYVPGLLKHFTTASINALIAPRPHLSLAGELDALTPVDGLERVDRELQKVYAAASAPEAWSLKRYPVGHCETPAMRTEVLTFLERWL